MTLSSKSTTPSSIVSLLSELDVVLPADRISSVVDHFNYDTVSASDKHDVLILDTPTNVRPGLKKYLELPGGVLAVPHAAAHALGASQLLTPILRAPRTAYSYNPREQAEVVDADELFAAGSQLGLVSVVQARNSARVTVLGSADLLQDKWFDAKVARVGDKKVKTENREFARRLSGWTFQEVGVLRVNDVEHRLHGDNETNPSIYRIKTKVVSTTIRRLFLAYGLTIYSLTASPCPSTAGPSGNPSPYRTRTLSSSSFPCCPRSSASTLPLP